MKNTEYTIEETFERVRSGENYGVINIFPDIDIYCGGYLNFGYQKSWYDRKPFEYIEYDNESVYVHLKKECPKKISLDDLMQLFANNQLI